MRTLDIGQWAHLQCNEVHLPIFRLRRLYVSILPALPVQVAAREFTPLTISVPPLTISVLLRIALFRPWLSLPWHTVEF